MKGNEDCFLSVVILWSHLKMHALISTFLTLAVLPYVNSKCRVVTICAGSLFVALSVRLFGPNPFIFLLFIIARVTYP